LPYPVAISQETSEGAGERSRRGISYLFYLATQRNVAPSTQNQALNALVFLYREFLKQDLDGLDGISWAKKKERVPEIFSPSEVSAILSELSGTQALIASLLYGCGLRLAECIRLRTKDIDFDRNQIAIWDSKSPKDRKVMLPPSAKEMLLAQLKKTRMLHDSDRAKGIPGVFLPHALARKYPNAAIA